MTKIYTLSLLVLLFATSCSNQKLEKQQMLQEEVLAIHDSIMPKIGTLRSLKMRTAKQIDFFQQEGNTKALEALQSRLTELERGDKGMFEWMHSYKNPEKDNYSEETMGYLQDKKKEILVVKTQMLSAIANTQKTLDSLPELK